MSQPPTTLIEALTADDSLVVAGHVTPDADCLSSMFAIAQGIRQATGKTVACALPEDSVAGKLQFLLDWGEPRIAGLEACRNAGTIVVCDTAQARRANLPERLSHTLEEDHTVINIDHHVSNTCFGAMQWIDAEASSCAELIHRLFKSAGWAVSPTIASMLYTGIASDTMGFSLPNTSGRALAAAAELVECGADVTTIGNHMFRSLSQNEFNLRRVIYDNSRLSASGRIAFSTASHHEIMRAGCTAADVDDQVEIPRSLTGKQLAILFTEGVHNKIRMNFRSEGDISVLDLARQIGGGGHHAAAGAIIDGTIEDAVSTVIPLAERFLDGVEVQARPPS